MAGSSRASRKQSEGGLSRRNGRMLMGGDLGAQVAALAKAPVAQRQVMLSQIGHSQGNRHASQVASALQRLRDPQLTQAGLDAGERDAVQELPAATRQAGEPDREDAPTAGEPSITVTKKAKSLSEQGSAEYKVQWSVAGKKSGWIIQHVTFTANVTDCAGKEVEPKNPKHLEYWEGWEVKDGKVYVGYASGGAKHSADTFRTINEADKTKGTVTITGKVKFIEDYKLKSPPWGHTVPEAGALPTMKSAPAGWSDGSADDHIMKVEFDCCGKTPTQKVTTTP